MNHLQCVNREWQTGGMGHELPRHLIAAAAAVPLKAATPVVRHRGR
jgi:hypothetical protein